MPRITRSLRSVSLQSSQPVRRVGQVSSNYSPAIVCPSINSCRSFDLCDGSGAASAFFPPNIEALYGYYEEVTYNEWVGYDGEVLWNGACLKGESAPFWGQPDSTGCGNTGMEFLSLSLRGMAHICTHTRRGPLNELGGTALRDKVLMLVGSSCSRPYKSKKEKEKERGPSLTFEGERERPRVP